MKVQRAMFLENLWRQMDKMSASKGKSEIAKVASNYLSEGYENNEVVELLVDGGCDPVLAKSCGGCRKWGFEVEADDQRGDIANNFDLGLDGVAGDGEEAAQDNAQVLVDAECPGQYTVTRVFAL